MASSIRVVIQQPALPHYRVPVFRELARRPGIDLRVVYGCEPDLPNVEPEGFTGEFWPQKRLRLQQQDFFFHGCLSRYTRRDAADVVIAAWNSRYLNLPLAMKRARRHQIGFVLWGHGYSKRERGWRRSLRNRIANAADALLLYNNEAAVRLIEEGFARDRVFVGINSLDQTENFRAKDYWHRHPERLERFRAERRLDGNPIILFVSRLDPRNRLDLLIAALPELLRSQPRAQVVMIGKGDAERQRLLQLAEKYQVADRVRFEGAIYDSQELGGYFVCAHVFCYPHNIGLSILHAFAFGLPVVTSDHMSGQNPEIEALRPGTNGAVYEHDDPGSLARALADVVNSKQRESMAREALRTVTEIHTVPRMVDGFVAAIRCAAERREAS